MIYKKNEIQSVVLTQKIAETLIQKMNNNEYIHFCNQIQIFKLISPPDSAIYLEYLPKNKGKQKACYRFYIGISYEFNYEIKELCKTILQYKRGNSSDTQTLENYVENLFKTNCEFEEYKIDMIIRKLFNSLNKRQINIPSEIKGEQWVNPSSVFYNIPQKDFINRKDIKHPFIFFNKDSLDKCLDLANQKTYINSFIQQYKQNKIYQVSKKQIEDSYILILIWEIKEFIQYQHKIENVNLAYYPFIKTFLIYVTDFNKLWKPLFINHYHKIKFIRQCSQNQSIEEQKNYFLQNEELIQFLFFDVHNYDQIGDNQKLVNIRNSNSNYIEKIKNRIEQIKISRQPSTVDNTQIRFLIKPKNYDLIHSSECQIKKGELLNHIIDVDQMICKFCQQQIRDPTSLFINTRLYEVYMNICDILMFGYQDHDPEIYLYESKIKLTISTEENQDQLIWIFRDEILFTWYFHQDIQRSLRNFEDIQFPYKGIYQSQELSNEEYL